MSKHAVMEPDVRARVKQLFAAAMPGLQRDLAEYQRLFAGSTGEQRAAILVPVQLPVLAALMAVAFTSDIADEILLEQTAVKEARARAGDGADG